MYKQCNQLNNQTTKQPDNKTTRQQNNQTTLLLERHSEGKSDALLIAGRQFEIVHTAYILHVENLEDIMYAGNELDVRLVFIHEVTAFREYHEHIASCILFEVWIILVGQGAPKRLYADILTPL